MAAAPASPPWPASRSASPSLAWSQRFGVAELIQASNLLYETLRWAGVLFLLFLAFEGWARERMSVSARSVDHDAISPAAW